MVLFAKLYMQITCKYTNRMSKMIQIRNVPDGLHRKLKARAAWAGMSLSEYLLVEIRQSAERPTVAEIRDRLETRTPVKPSVPPADMIRMERDIR